MISKSPSPSTPCFTLYAFRSARWYGKYERGSQFTFLIHGNGFEPSDGHANSLTWCVWVFDPRDNMNIHVQFWYDPDRNMLKWDIKHPPNVVSRCNPYRTAVFLVMFSNMTHVHLLLFIVRRCCRHGFHPWNCCSDRTVIDSLMITWVSPSHSEALPTSIFINTFI